MSKTVKSSRQKLETVQEPKVIRTDKGKMLIPRPLDVDALVRKAQKGKLLTVADIRERLARDQGADYSCPMTTGIFLRMVAEATEEDLAAGKKRIAPYWRVIREDGSLVDKFPGGVAAQAARLKQEGHSILPGKGKKPPTVQDFAKAVQKL